MDLTKKHCVPCEGGVEPYTRKKIEEYIKLLDDKWEVIDDKKIRKNFLFDSYMDGINFVVEVGKLADSEGHHPDMLVVYKRVEVTLTTHAIGGLSENDFILASKINLIA